MVKTTTDHTRAANFAILVIAMVVLIVVLGVLLYWVLAGAAAAARPEQKRYLTALACLVVAVLLFTVLLLVLRVIRYTAARLKGPAESFKPTVYEDAWAEAGRRLKPEDAPPVEGFEDREDDS